MKDAVYGFPCVSDPRDFQPDTECCTPEEIEAWKRDVDLTEKGEWERDPSKFCETFYDTDGNLTKHVTRTPRGIGVNMVDVEDK